MSDVDAQESTFDGNVTVNIPHAISTLYPAPHQVTILKALLTTPQRIQPVSHLGDHESPRKECVDAQQRIGTLGNEEYPVTSTFGC